MGAIFEAEHTGTERRVALKLLFPHIMSMASAREKFELEAKVAARVNSPHIVQVLDAGFDEASQSPYLVMELLHGETLGAMIKSRGALPPREVIALLRQVAAGLDAAHGYKDAAGVTMPIVHRDLKPENLFVMPEREGVSLVKILDFGIAKVLSDTGNVSQEVRGTPLYMAYEQVTAGRLSPATDIWALGLIAYHLLTGERYWRSARAEGAGVQSLFAEILTLPLEAPSLRMQQQGLSAGLGEAFDAWLLKCIDREPARRFSSAGEAIEALGRAFAQPAAAAARAPLPVRPTEISRTATFHAPGAAVARAGTAPSLSAMASERSPATGRERSTRTLLIAGLALAGVVAVAGVIWIAGSGSAPPVAKENANDGKAPISAGPSEPAPPPAPAPAQPATAPAEAAARAPVIAPIPMSALSAGDAGAAKAVKEDYPVPTWPPPPLPGEEATDLKPVPLEKRPAKPPESAPPRVITEPASKTAPAKPPATKPGAKPGKFNPYDMR